MKYGLEIYSWDRFDIENCDVSQSQIIYQTEKYIFKIILKMYRILYRILDGKYILYKIK